MTKLEQEMERLQASQSILESSLADTGFYQEDRKQDLKQLLAEKAEVDRQLQAIETDWFAIGEQLEAAQLQETD
jgi:ATP-binding cassette subfamily F protein 3